MENVIETLIAQVQETINQAIEDGGENMERTLLMNKGGLNLLNNLKQNGYVISEPKETDAMHEVVVGEISANTQTIEVDVSL